MILDKNLYHEKGLIKGLFQYITSLSSFYGKIFLGLRNDTSYLNRSGNVKGIPYLIKNENGAIMCNSCSLCAEICPTKAITLTGVKENLSGPPKDLEIDITKCTFCADCISICPENALANSQVNLISFDNVDTKVFNKEVLKSFSMELKIPVQTKVDLKKNIEKEDS